MSRFRDGDIDSEEALLAWGRWEGRRKMVLQGRPGKQALARLEQALLRLPHKRLIEGSLCDGTGVCAMGAWLYSHYVDDEGVTPREAWSLLKESAGDRSDETDRFWSTVSAGKEDLGITETLAIVVAQINDEYAAAMTPEQRYGFVFNWVQRHREAA